MAEREQHGRPSVLAAAEVGNIIVYIFRMNTRADAALVDNRDRRILHASCVVGNLKVLKEILAKDVEELHGQMPVMKAGAVGHMKLFMTKGAIKSVEDAGGDTILYVACLGGNMDVVRQIICADSKELYGGMSVMMASEQGNVDVFKSLLTQRTDVSVVDGHAINIRIAAYINAHMNMVKDIVSPRILSIEHGRTAVMMAAGEGQEDVFDMRVSEGSNSSVMDPVGESILRVAYACGNADIVRRIISRNIVSIDSKEQKGKTLLMLAAQKGLFAIFNLLVTEGADLTLEDDNGSNILYVGCLGGNVDIVRCIISQNIVSIDSTLHDGATLLMIAALKGLITMFNLLVTEGADLTLKDDYGSNILHAACFWGNVDIVKHIISHNIFSIESRGESGKTPVMYAADRGHMDVFKLLVTEGADLSIVDDDGENILHRACDGGNVDMVKHIISQNMVSIESKGCLAKTPVMYAADRGHLDVFKLLVSEGADLSIVDNSSYNILHGACMCRNVEIVKHMISRHIASIESTGHDGKTPVMMAVQGGHMGLFKLLVTEGADLSKVDDLGDNILHIACYGSNEDMVKDILSRNIISIASKGLFSRTPVMIAAERGQMGLFKLLVTCGADLSIVDSGGDNILHLACAGGDVDIAKHILSRNIVSLESNGEYGMTPVLIACARGHMGVFRLLLTEGADLSMVDARGDSILHLACLNANVDMVMMIISQNRVSIDSKGQYGRTPVMIAAEYRYINIFRLLVTEGADLSIVDDYGNNVLHRACMGGSVDIVKHILSRNIVSIQSKGQKGTPMVISVEGGHLDVFKLLVTYGADLSSMDDNGNTILHKACYGRNVDIVKDILSRNGVSIDRIGLLGMTPLLIAAARGHLSIFKLLITEGADPSIVNARGDSILHLACLNANLDMVRVIISQGLVSIDSKGQSGRTPVMNAVRKGHMDVVKMLVTEGANLYISDVRGDNILHAACMGGNLEMVKYIISQSLVSINSKGYYGKTPLMIAAWQGHLDVIKLVLTEGADVSIVDDGGNNILHTHVQYMRDISHSL